MGPLHICIDILICSISIFLLVNTTTNIYMRILEASRSYTTTTLRPFWDFPQLGKNLNEKNKILQVKRNKQYININCK